MGAQEMGERGKVNDSYSGHGTQIGQVFEFRISTDCINYILGSSLFPSLAAVIRYFLVFYGLFYS